MQVHGARHDRHARLSTSLVEHAVPRLGLNDDAGALAFTTVPFFTSVLTGVTVVVVVMVAVGLPAFNSCRQRLPVDGEAESEKYHQLLRALRRQRPRGCHPA
jgi:hypothetical protein